MKERCDDEFKVSDELRRPEKMVSITKLNRHLFVREKGKPESTTCSDFLLCIFFNFLFTFSVNYITQYMYFKINRKDKTGLALLFIL